MHDFDTFLGGWDTTYTSVPVAYADMSKRLHNRCRIHSSFTGAELAVEIDKLIPKDPKGV